VLLTLLQSPTGSDVHVWDGTDWGDATLRVWDGSAWQTRPVNVWDGSAWHTVDNN
jgi:hypothetical protein